ncbi:UDP-4-amino-4,6-dideoxy-N-acetyl-beta-L-altrosamine N-acetyltransferase [Bradyrhizobium cenepequi]
MVVWSKGTDLKLPRQGCFVSEQEVESNRLEISWRPTTLADSDLLFRWRNSPHVAEFQYTDHVITREEHDAWLPRVLADDRRAYWIVEVDGKPVGLANLAAIDMHNRRCEWAFYIGESELVGKGVGSWIERQVLREVFLKRELNKLSCEVLDDNEAANAIHRKFGFTQEGFFRDHVVKGGRPRNIICYAMRRADYLTKFADDP